MNYYETILNRHPVCSRPLLTATQADAKIAELEAELASAMLMISVLKASIAEKDMVIKAAAGRYRDADTD